MSRESVTAADRQGLREQVADVLAVAPEEVGDHEDLSLLGLDSIRIMSLISTWRATGIDVTFEDLAERPTFAEWAELLTSRRA
jgi:bifunctional isochorismate lyase / aryl carrier protein